VYQCGSRKPAAGVSKKSLLFLELLASIGINDIVVRKKMGGGGGGFGDGGQGGDGGGGGQGKAAEEQIAKEKRKALDAKSTGTQHRQETAIRAERVPHI
jgi:hypothetical protein